MVDYKFSIILLIGGIILIFVGLLTIIFQQNNFINLQNETLVNRVYDPMLEKVNKIRNENNLMPLIGIKQLEDSAQKRACYLKDHPEIWNHTDFSKWIKETGFDGRKLGENLGRYISSDDVAITSWMNSKKHREAILDPRYFAIGIGRCGSYYVQHFAGK